MTRSAPATPSIVSMGLDQPDAGLGVGAADPTACHAPLVIAADRSARVFQGLGGRNPSSAPESRRWRSRWRYPCPWCRHRRWPRSRSAAPVSPCRYRGPCAPRAPRRTRGGAPSIPARPCIPRRFRAPCEFPHRRGASAPFRRIRGTRPAPSDRVLGVARGSRVAREDFRILELRRALAPRAGAAARRRAVLARRRARLPTEVAVDHPDREFRVRLPLRRQSGCRRRSSRAPSPRPQAAAGAGCRRRRAGSPKATSGWPTSVFRLATR